jgi:hypothetical protein
MHVLQRVIDATRRDASEHHDAACPLRLVSQQQFQMQLLIFFGLSVSFLVRS